MNTQEIATAFTELCKKGEFEQAGDRFWSDSIVSLEPGDGPMARCEGRAAVDAKGAWWTSNTEVHSVETEGPFVHGEQFILRFAMDITPKGEARTQMIETGLYTVRDGKVVEERFFYGS